MSTETNVNALDYVQASGEALESARVLAEKVAAEAEKAAPIASRNVDLMLSTSLIEPSEKSAGLEKQSTLEGALEVVGNLINILASERSDHQRKLAEAGNGKGVEPRSKQADSQTDDVMSGGYIGRRMGLGEKSAADLAFERRLGGTSRT